MSDVSFALEANSSQLNAMDIVGAEPIIKIKQVDVKQGDQPVSIYYEGDNGRPWKPCKSMLRIIAAAWGRDSSAWPGQHVQLFFEPKVRYAGKEVGGIRIKAMTGIAEKGANFVVTINSKQREPYHVALLTPPTSEYPADRFAKALPAMTEKMQSGEMTLQQVIAQCQKTGQLSPEQLAQLEQAAPAIVDNEDDEVM